MALPAGRYGVTKNQLLKIKKLPMNTIKLIEELTEKFDLLGTAAFKNSTSVVTQSTDLVESGAVENIIGWGNKNKLKGLATVSNNGVTATLQNNGAMLITGSISSGTYAILNILLDKPLDLPNGEYVFSVDTAIDYVRYEVYGYDSDFEKIGEIVAGGTACTVTVSKNYQYFRINLIITNNAVYDNKTIYPMLSKDGGAYEPYHASVEEYCASKEDVINTVGWIGDNKIKRTLNDVKNSSTSSVWDGNETTLNGITFNVSTDQNGYISSIRAHGQLTTSSGTSLRISNRITYPMHLPVGVYKLNSGVNSGNTYLILGRTYNGTWQELARSLGVDAVFTIDSANDNLGLSIDIYDTSPIDYTFYPTITPLNVDEKKCDNSVIGTTENSATVQKSGGYAAGSHAIRNGKFITWKNAKAQGETINDASDYTSGDVAECLIKQATFSGTTTGNGNVKLNSDESTTILACEVSERICIPYKISLETSPNKGNWAHIISTDGTTSANVQVSGTYYYI